MYSLRQTAACTAYWSTLYSILYSKKKFFLQILCKLLQRWLRPPQNTRHIRVIPHSRDRGGAQNSTSVWYDAVLCSSEVLQHVTDLLRTGIYHNQAWSTENGGRRMRLSVDDFQFVFSKFFWLRILHEFANRLNRQYFVIESAF